MIRTSYNSLPCQFLLRTFLYNNGRRIHRYYRCLIQRCSNCHIRCQSQTSQSCQGWTNHIIPASIFCFQIELGCHRFLSVRNKRYRWRYARDCQDCSAKDFHCFLVIILVQIDYWEKVLGSLQLVYSRCVKTNKARSSRKEKPVGDRCFFTASSSSSVVDFAIQSHQITRKRWHHPYHFQKDIK